MIFTATPEIIPATITLESGEQFNCYTYQQVDVGAELVFNTAICGYQEIITDPSYAEQAVVFTTAQVGNTGINQQDYESANIQVKAIVVNAPIHQMSNWRAQNSLPEWLAQHDTPFLFGCNTRALTIRLRTSGSARVWITTDILDAHQLRTKALQVPCLEGRDIAHRVSCTKPYRWHQGTLDIMTNTHQHATAKKKVVVYDFGTKYAILRLLVDYDGDVEVVPARTSLNDVLDKQPDGVVLSNGPGDPSVCGYAINAAKGLIAAGIPIFGICLGYQILCLTLGAKTKKMLFGHHGANHPVQDLRTKRVYITSQNHSFVVDATSLDDRLISHISLFDLTVQGICSPEKKILGFQGHPEASPGPADVQYGLFRQFFDFMC